MITKTSLADWLVFLFCAGIILLIVALFVEEILGISLLKVFG